MNRHETSLPPRAASMQRSGDEVLPRAGLAPDQHRDLLRTDFLDDLKHLEHGGRLSDHPLVDPRAAQELGAVDDARGLFEVATGPRQRIEPGVSEESLPCTGGHQLGDEVARVSTAMKIAPRFLNISLAERDPGSEVLQTPVQLEKRRPDDRPARLEERVSGLGAG